MTRRNKIALIPRMHPSLRRREESYPMSKTPELFENIGYRDGNGYMGH